MTNTHALALERTHAHAHTCARTHPHGLLVRAPAWRPKISSQGFNPHLGQGCGATLVVQEQAQNCKPKSNKRNKRDTYIPTHKHTHTCTHTCTHAHTHIYTHTHTCTCMHTHTHAHTIAYSPSPTMLSVDVILPRTEAGADHFFFNDNVTAYCVI